MSDDNQTSELPLYDLPEHLHPHFDAMVADWNAVAFDVGPDALASYRILAELVKAGWRKSTPPE